MKKTISSQHTAGGRGNLTSYLTGFVFSIVLTLAAYVLVSNYVSNDGQSFSRSFVIVSIIGLAVAQLLVQLQFFIHLGKESGPRWNKLMFMFMLLVLFIVVGGSLWIMNHLQHYNMSPNQTETYIIEEEGIAH